LEEALKRQIAKAIKKGLSPADAKRALELSSFIEKEEDRNLVQRDFLSYVKRVWPDFIAGEHHRKIANAFDRIVSGDLKRLIINLPPRHTKSEFASRLLPSYYLGKYPNQKVIQAGHTASLAEDFGRQTRDLIASDRYKDIFPDTSLKADSKAAGRWNTSAGGTYFAIGVGGNVAGRGANLFIIDDPHSEQDTFGSGTESFKTVLKWFYSGPRQRLQPQAAIVIVMTRWHEIDLTGGLLRDAKERGTGDEWEVITMPAISKAKEPLWPEYWSLKEMQALQKELPAAHWAAQYQQDPSSESGAIIKRGDWKVWSGDSPKVNGIIMAYDTAYTKSEMNDPSACTVWGTFEVDGDNGESETHILLLNAWEDYLEYPELKKQAIRDNARWQPDILLIEAKSAGLPLIQELRRTGIPAQEFKVTRGTTKNPNDKNSRIHSISSLFNAGRVWRPNTAWAENVAEQLARFPHGAHDDLCDTVYMSLSKYRTGGFITLPTDIPSAWKPRTTHVYY